MSDRYFDRSGIWDDDPFFDEDEDRRERLGRMECPKCGEEVPKDHCDTDTGSCISCEDKEYEKRREAEELEAVYDLCLTGLIQKPITGDQVTLAFTYIGLTSYELYTIDRVRGEKVWIDGHDHAFLWRSGTYQGDDMGASRKLILDGGAKFRETHPPKKKGKK